MAFCCTFSALCEELFLSTKCYRHSVFQTFLATLWVTRTTSEPGDATSVPHLLLWIFDGEDSGHCQKYFGCWEGSSSTEFHYGSLAHVWFKLKKCAKAK